MATCWDSAGDPRGVDELIRVALAEFDLCDEELRSATAALVALQFRPTREVLDRACALCRSADADERRFGVRVLGELRDLDDPAAVRELGDSPRRPVFVPGAARRSAHSSG